MEKFKKFITSPVGLLVLVVVVVVAVAAYADRIPGFRWLKSNVASKLPGAAAA